MLRLRFLAPLAAFIPLVAGVTGVPKTSVIRTAWIRFRYPGPLTEEVWRETFEPLLKDLRGEK